MNIAFIGCGHVADFYMHTLARHENLCLVGVYDRDHARMRAFATFYKLPTYSGLNALLQDATIDAVVNLTNPSSHFDINKRCLEAGKHVYSEKPLAMRFEEAEELVALAARRKLYLASAPASMLGESAQTMWKALRNNLIGTVRLVYANLDGGMVHKRQPWKRKGRSGAPWPARDEFSTGCTFEHAGYYLTWLAMFFGPAKSLTSFSACLIPDKDIPVDVMAPDFSVGAIEYENNVVARITNSIVAPQDHSITIIGDDGILYTGDAWDFASPVILRKGPPIVWKRLVQAALNRVILWTPGMTGLARYERRLEHVRKVTFAPQAGRGSIRMDFLCGPAEMADAVEQRRDCRLSAELALHVTDLTAALQCPDSSRRTYTPRSTVGAIQPMPWAK